MFYAQWLTMVVGLDIMNGRPLGRGSGQVKLGMRSGESRNHLSIRGGPECMFCT
jgi:hypothetical protein